eukprot:8129887-Pyramimonas_sp.AAC.1
MAAQKRRSCKMAEKRACQRGRAPARATCSPPGVVPCLNKTQHSAPALARSGSWGNPAAAWLRE